MVIAHIFYKSETVNKRAIDYSHLVARREGWSRFEPDESDVVFAHPQRIDDAGINLRRPVSTHTRCETPSVD